MKPVYKRTSREVTVSVGQDVLEWLEKNRFSSNVLIPNLPKAFIDSYQRK